MATLVGYLCDGCGNAECSQLPVIDWISCDRYTGELISDVEADRREVDTYLFDLDNQVSDIIELLSK